MKSKNCEISRTDDNVRFFNGKSLRTGLSYLNYDNPVRKLFVHEVSHNKLELTTFLWFNQYSVTDFIVLVIDFIVVGQQKLFIKNKGADSALSFYMQKRIFGRNKVVDWETLLF